MNEILISILLTVPPFDNYSHWEVNQVPHQLQVIHEDQCLTVSYMARPVSCMWTPGPKQRLMVPDSDWMPVCYLVINIEQPEFIKSCNFNFVKGVKKR